MTNETQLWHVTVTVGGDPHEPSKTHAGLARLIAERPFIHSALYAENRAEVSYWEESGDMVDAASLALRMWNEHRTSADLPDWKTVGLEVVDEDTHRLREAPAPRLASTVTPRRSLRRPPRSRRRDRGLGAHAPLDPLALTHVVVSHHHGSGPRARPAGASARHRGLSIFAFFCIVMLGLLMFGKGRPHA